MSRAPSDPSATADVPTPLAASCAEPTEPSARSAVPTERSAIAGLLTAPGMSLPIVTERLASFASVIEWLRTLLSSRNAPRVRSRTFTVRSLIARVVTEPFRSCLPSSRL
jgi:hypothetical protein